MNLPRVVDEQGRAVPELERAGPRRLVEVSPPPGLWRTATEGGPVAGTAALLLLGAWTALRGRGDRR